MKQRYELSDIQWERIAPCLPVARTGRPATDPRKIWNGIFWILNSGAAWRDLPERYGPWKTVYHRFNVWSKQGVLDCVLRSLRLELMEDGYIDPETWMIDSTSVKAHPAAAGAKKKRPSAPRA